MRFADLGLVLIAILVGACAATAPPTRAELERQVAETERGFAKTMADRDAARFNAFLSEEAVFFSGPGAAPLRGKRQVSEQWARFFARPQAPFSWEPDEVQVLDSGTLALSSGPVRDPKGKVFARFTSIWRQEAPGVWRIVFDKGSDVCDCGGAASADPPAH